MNRIGAIVYTKKTDRMNSLNNLHGLSKNAAYSSILNELKERLDKLPPRPLDTVIAFQIHTPEGITVNCWCD